MPPLKAKPLNARQERFVAEYLRTMCGSKAALAAGYSARIAGRYAFTLLRDPRVLKAVAEGRQRKLKRVEIKTDEVLLEILRVLRSDVRQLVGEDGKLKDIKTLAPETARAVAGVDVVRRKNLQGEVEEVVKVRFWDKVRALELAAKHLGLLGEDQGGGGFTLVLPAGTYVDVGRPLTSIPGQPAKLPAAEEPEP